MSLEVLLWLPGIDKQLIEMSGVGWERPLSCSGLQEADDDYYHNVIHPSHSKKSIATQL